MDLKRGLIGAMLGVSLFASLAFGVDYSAMSTGELSKMRGTMQNSTAEERNAFQNEWQTRVQNMTQEERQQYAGKPENAGQQRGSGMGGGRGGRR